MFGLFVVINVYFLNMISHAWAGSVASSELTNARPILHSLRQRYRVVIWDTPIQLTI